MEAKDPAPGAGRAEERQPSSPPLPDWLWGNMSEYSPQGRAWLASPIFSRHLPGRSEGEVAWTEAENDGVQIKSYGFCWDRSPPNNFSFHLL